MNIEKIQKDLLKDAIKRDDWHSSAFNWKYAEDEKTIYLIPDGFRIICIKKHQFYLDINKVIPAVPMHIDLIIGTAKDKAEFTDEYIKTKDPKGKNITLARFTCNGTSIWIQEEYLKIYDLLNATFKATDEKSPLEIYEFDELVGIISPFRRKEESE